MTYASVLLWLDIGNILNYQDVKLMVLSIIRQLIQALILQNYMQLSNFDFKFTVIMKNLVTQEYKHSL